MKWRGMRFLVKFNLLLTGPMAVACSSSTFEIAAGGDAARDAAGEISDSMADSMVPSGSCAGVKDGVPCGPADGLRRLCLLGACVVSRCGDGFVDGPREETCDDGNDVPGDGCESTCKLTCSIPDDCDDRNPCTLGETCNVTTHQCVAGTTAPKGTPCKTLELPTGTCNGSTCAPVGCGNGTVEVGEDCDDGNSVNDDGCRSDCRFTCKADADCDDSSVCTGAERCDLGTHRCVAGAALTCDDANACTKDTCDPKAGCQNKLVDADGDGEAPTSLGPCGKDCNDGNPSVTSTAVEVCDGIDNDCDGLVDEGLLKACYADGDGDGYGVKSAITTACACPAGTTARSDAFDCADGVAAANPGQTAFFATAYSTSTGPSFDYDCNGVEQRQDLALGGCAIAGSGCTATVGWKALEAPACGVAQAYVTECKLLSAACQPITISKTQRCR